MPDKRSRAIELLRQAANHLEILLNHMSNMDIRSAGDLTDAQSDPSAYERYRAFDFIAHQIDLSTEGIRQIREMKQLDVLEALERNMAHGSVRLFADLHGHLFHTYDGIDADLLWETATVDCPMMLEALNATIRQLDDSTPYDRVQGDTDDIAAILEGKFSETRSASKPESPQAQ